MKSAYLQNVWVKKSGLNGFIYYSLFKLVLVESKGESVTIKFCFRRFVSTAIHVLVHRYDDRWWHMSIFSFVVRWGDLMSQMDQCQQHKAMNSWTRAAKSMSAESHCANSRPFCIVNLDNTKRYICFFVIMWHQYNCDCPLSNCTLVFDIMHLTRISQQIRHYLSNVLAVQWYGGIEETCTLISYTFAKHQKS